MIEKIHALHRAWRYRLRSEREELAYIRSLNLAGATVIDIGAFHGIYSYWLHRAVGPSGNVIAFEPQPEMAEYLGRLKSGFRLDRLTIVNAGLSSEPGEATLVRRPGHWGGSSVEKEAAPGLEEVAIRLTTLDEQIDASGAGPIAFIKCDVEGHERAVFDGGAKMLARDKPTLLVECHDRRVKNGGLFTDLDAYGYQAFFFDHGRLQPMSEYAARRDSIDKPYLNYVFVAGE
ncbi:MAG: FkbM family methyltransferase [Planctomycetes bacterium]|nr:FkbM family methyltransferase [Planctomycetota bacterium]